MFLAILNGMVNQLGIFWFLGCGEDQRGIGGGILWLVLFDSCCMSVWTMEDSSIVRLTVEISGVANNDLCRKSVAVVGMSMVGQSLAYCARFFQLIK